MVAGALGGVLKFRYLFVLWAFVYVFATLLIGIYSGGVHYYKTGEAKPLVDATIGKVVGADVLIYENVMRLKDPNIDSKLATFLRQETIQSLLIFLLMWYILYWVLLRIARFGMSPATESAGLHFFMIAMALVILLTTSALFNGIYLNKWQFPFRGLVELIKNWKLVFTNIGVTPIVPELNPVNGTISNITNGG